MKPDSDNSNDGTGGALGDVYKYHHRNNRERGSSILKESRGAFLRRVIGTNKKVLDVGCRDGALTSTYCQGNDVLGLDIDSESLSICSDNLGIKTRQSDLNGEWNVGHDSYDAVVAGEVIEHVYYPAIFTGKASQSLKSDGVFVGSTPNAFSLINRLRLFFGKKKGTPLEDPTHINHFTRSELLRILKEHFNEVKIHPVGRYAALDKFWPGMFAWAFWFEARNKK